MSEENMETEESAEVETATEEPQGSETDWKAEARKWEKRAKDSLQYKDAAEKWEEYEKSLKPAQERLAEENAELKNKAQAAHVQLLKYEVAKEKELPIEAVSILAGNSREELEEAADALMNLIATQSEPKGPRPDPNQGKPATRGSSTADLFAEALGELL